MFRLCSFPLRLASILSIGALALPLGAHAAPPASLLTQPLALEAAAEALRSCERAGYRVSVAVVDTAGHPRAQLRGDRSTPHTFETAFRKAYSVITFGPNYGVETSAEVMTLMNRVPTLYQAILTLPHVTPLPGAVLIRSGGEAVGAIGLSGAPGGEKDEACARAGIAKIADRLAR